MPMGNGFIFENTSRLFRERNFLEIIVHILVIWNVVGSVLPCGKIFLPGKGDKGKDGLQNYEHEINGH